MTNKEKKQYDHKVQLILQICFGLKLNCLFIKIHEDRKEEMETSCKNAVVLQT